MVAPRIRAAFPQRLAKDRRGSASLVFAASAFILFGALALAADTGLIYTAKRGAQNSADVSATAAAAALALDGPAGARQAALDVSARNGFAHGGRTTVTVNIPPSAGPRTGDRNAVEVVVRQTQGLGTAGLFTSTPATVGARAVASLRSNSGVCILALTGPVQAGGNTGVNTPDCIIASNMRGPGSVTVNGDSLSLNAWTLSAVGTCVNCANPGVTLTEPFREWQVPAENPFAHLDSKVLPALGSNPINANSVNGGTLESFERNGGRVLRGNLRITGNQVLDLRPGTHYIYNGDFDVQSGEVRCSGCTGGAGVTIVLGGSPSTIGGITINANAIVNLRAPTSPADPDFRGVLMYRAASATTTSASNPPVKINGGSTLSLHGGLYFPTSHVRVNGNAGTVACSVLVGGSVEFRGNARLVGCPAMGTPVPRTRSIVMAE